MTPEGQLKSDCRKIAKAAGLFFANVQGKGINGIPDTICEHTDQLGLVWMEFKRPDGKGVVSEQQHERAADIRRAGDRVYFITSIVQFKQAVGL